MHIFAAITNDVPLESLRAFVVAGLFAYVLITGRRTGQALLKGWSLLLWGFGLLLFASVLDITDNFPQLNAFVIVGDTHVQAFLEKVVGYLGGFVLIFGGFMRWLPLVTKGAKVHEFQALAEIQQRYRDLVDLSPDAIILHRKGKIIYANDAAAHLVNATSPKALCGKPIADFIHPDFRQLSRQRLQTLSTNVSKKLPLITIKIITTQDEARDVEVASGITNFNGEMVVQSVMRDISARVRAESALKESESDLRSIFDNMTEFFYRADLNGLITRVSGSSLEVMGWHRDDIIGLRIADHYVDPEGRKKFLAALQAADGSLRNYEAQMTRRDGERIWVSTNAQYYKDKDGTICGVEGTVRDITETVQARDVLQHMAMHDVLTGLGNRRSFEARLKEALLRARRSQIGGGILYFDLDGFKAINDSYGHDLGDNVLRQVGRRLKTLARETDYVARIGGDEFCLIIEGAAERAAIERVVEKLIPTLCEPYDTAGRTLTLGVSVGIVAFDGSEAEDSVHTLITRADKAMYQAKSTGGNKACFASGPIYEKAVS
ncbi:MAG TPA: sensor domain-containing diguanylate cyclase [Magnetovibrio sp.]